MTRQQPAPTTSPARAPGAIRPFFPEGFREGDEDVNGTRIHFVIGGKGSPVLLLHGYTQTHLMWWRLAPALAKQHTVLIPDLRGAGASAAPEQGYDKETMARDMRALVKKLGFDKVSIVGHDIGLMVAYAYAARFPSEVERLALLDAFLPGIEPWSGQLRSSHDVWHFWTDMAANPQAIGEAERQAYTEAYAAPGRLHSTWGYFQALEQDKKDFRELARNKLPMPVMVIGGDRSMGEPLTAQVRAVATHVEPHILQDTGHWVTEERPEEVRQLLGDFLRA